MRFTLRLIFAFVTSLLLVSWSHEQTSGSRKGPVPVKEIDIIPSIDRLQAALQADPHSPKLHIQPGRARWNAGEYEAALDGDAEIAAVHLRRVVRTAISLPRGDRE
jgi:hypothetical protein